MISLRVRGLKACGRAQRIGFVRALPGKAVARSAKMAVCCGSTVNGALQIEHIDKAFWAQIKVFAD